MIPTSIIFMGIKEIFLSLVGQIAFKEIGKRYAKRLAIYALEKLRDEEWTNKDADEAIDGIIEDLKNGIPRKKSN